jgi:hypothetical protein
MPYLLDLGDTREYIDRHPDQCPLCHHKIAPQLIFPRKAPGLVYDSVLQVVYVCPNDQCQELFIAYFTYPSYQNDPNGAAYRLMTSRPVAPRTISFSQFVQDTSPAFCNIYNEAHTAEELHLTQVCGVCYRKALEFLIKDYLIKISPDNEAGIKSTYLGPCINNYVTDEKTKQVAKRATWLGNDETHYERRWIGKDLAALKSLIDLVIHWIEAEHLTNEALKSMPD